MTSLKELYEEIIRLRSDSLTYRQIANELGCSYTLPHKVLKQYAPELMNYLSTNVVRGNLPKMIRLRESGFSYREIGSYFELSGSTVRSAICQNAPELIETKEERKLKKEKRKQEIVELQRQGLTYEVIAKKTRLTKSAVSSLIAEARKEGIPLLPKRKPYPKLAPQQLEERDKEIATLYEQGLHPKEIADRFDIIPAQVYQIVWKVKPEINIQKRKLREKRDREIVKMVNAGSSQAEVANEFGMKANTVSIIVK